LGGGLSYLSGEYGFSSDAYRELDVVLVTGELVTATATNKYDDLFRALKGGANRFGIVTRYQVEAIHTCTKFSQYPNSSAEALIYATEKYVRAVNDPKACELHYGKCLRRVLILVLFSNPHGIHQCYQRKRLNW
jgi:FAD/FMN-containing dehydrogenase